MSNFWEEQAKSFEQAIKAAQLCKQMAREGHVQIVGEVPDPTDKDLIIEKLRKQLGIYTAKVLRLSLEIEYAENEVDQLKRKLHAAAISQHTPTN